MVDKNKSLTYKEAGVDTKAGERAVALMKSHVKKTFNPSVLTGLGGFSGMVELDLAGIEKPVLVSGTDGVGTKLKLAFLTDCHDTIGIDCVAMCINDILCQGAKPLFFLDYIATEKVVAEKIADIVKGVAQGCMLAECSLVGGETAEMPGFYQKDEYDLAGFAVGVVDKNKVITGERIKEGDCIIGLPSSGLHSNGFSLVRKLFFGTLNMEVNTFVPELNGTLGNLLLTPTKIYKKACDIMKETGEIKGLVHITGGGFYENIPRVLPGGLGVEIDKNSYEVPPLFSYMGEKGQISEKEMYGTFNMGIGMMAFVAPELSGKLIEALEAQGEKAYCIGKVVSKAGVFIE